MRLQEKAHIPALDGLRGIAILAVVWHHSFYESEGSSMVQFTGNPVSALYNLAHAAWTGVDLFFVLSGFLITGILLDSKASPGYYRNFYWRRALRIFPLYYAAIGAVYLLYGLTNSTTCHQMVPWLPWLLTYTTNVAMAAKHAWWFSNDTVDLDHFWSLAVEEQFYLLWPMIVFHCSRPRLRVVCFAVIGVALGWRTLAMLFTDNHWLVHYQLPARADSLAMGALAAIRIREGAFGKNIGAKLLASGALLLLTFLDVRMVPFVGLTAIAWFYESVMTAAMTTRLAVPLSFAPLRSVGKYSYGLYVIHMLLLKYVWHRTGLDHITSHRAIVCATTLFACSYAAAFLSWHLIEKRFLALKRYFPTPSEVPAVAPPSIAPALPSEYCPPSA